MALLKSFDQRPLPSCHSEEEQIDFRDYVLDMRGNRAWRGKRRKKNDATTRNLGAGTADTDVVLLLLISV